MGSDREKPAEMSLWGHLNALRSVVVRAVVVLVALMVVYFAVMRQLFESVILAPCHGDFILYRLFAKITEVMPMAPDFSTEGFDVQLINIQLASQFFIHMSSSFYLALVTACPFLLYLIWTFIRPALYEHEVHGIRVAFSLGTLMFYAGVAVGYFVIFPVTLRFLAEYQLSEMIPNQISLDSYMSTFFSMLLIMGIVFELPLVAWALSSIGLISKSFLRRYRRHAIVVLMIAAALITPTGDPFTLFIVFLPLYLLYELSILVVRRNESQPPSPTDD